MSLGLVDLVGTSYTEPQTFVVLAVTNSRLLWTRDEDH
jgi:hypothetical protein